MKFATHTFLSLLILGASAVASAQTPTTDRDTARKHAGCANTYNAMLERMQDNKDPGAKVTAEKLQALHQQTAIVLAGEEDAQRLLRATKSSLKLVLGTIEQTDSALENFYKRRVDTCTQLVNDLTDEQRARIEKLPK